MRTPTEEDVLEAAAALRGVVIETPVLRSPVLDSLTGGEIWLKCENLQKSGAFKFRGAYNRLRTFDAREYPGGVVAYSTGNHGQAVATVGKMLGIQTRIVMPQDAPAIKIEKARRSGAEIVLYNRDLEAREDIAAAIARSAPVAIVPPGDDPLVIAGQGTAVLEFLKASAPHSVDTIIVPCGGGGLAAGTVLATRAANVKAEVWAAEPEKFDDTLRSLVQGERVRNASQAGSICDALLAFTPAELPFSINRTGLARVVTASDDAVLKAMAFAFEELRIVLEPGGAVGLAAVLFQPDLLRGKRALIILSGGNVDPTMFAHSIAA